MPQEKEVSWIYSFWNVWKILGWNFCHYFLKIVKLNQSMSKDDKKAEYLSDEPGLQMYLWIRLSPYVTSRNILTIWKENFSMISFLIMFIAGQGQLLCQRIGYFPNAPWKTTEKEHLASIWNWSLQSIRLPSQFLWRCC